MLNIFKRNEEKKKKKKKKKQKIKLKLEKTQNQKVSIPRSIIIKKIVNYFDKLGFEKSVTYDKLIDDIFGKIEGKYRRFFLKWMLNSYLNYIRRKYSIHIYCVWDKDNVRYVLKILNRTEEFNEVIRKQKRRIAQIQSVVRKLEKDRDNPRYKDELEDRIRIFKHEEV